MSEYFVIGLMSGSSLDGLDVCFARFECQAEENWNFEILSAECFDYTEDFQNKLRLLPGQSAYSLAEMHAEFSKVQAAFVNQFFEKYPESKRANLIVSHGQTIFHQPKKSFTTQIGCGATLSALTGKTVVSDLRTFDIALGGQGAPMVPLGEKYLFGGYDSFLNIGGICNVSIHGRDGIRAFDVCPGNTLLNLLAVKQGQRYDDKGSIARSGSVNSELLHLLSQAEFYKIKGPKSLGTEHILELWWPLIEKFETSVEDKMATTVTHIAAETGKYLTGKTLVTGGGAFNDFLVEKLRQYTKAEIIIPSGEIIEYKEALIIAFAGLKRVLGQNNFISSVTGAQRDNMGGAIYG